MTVSSIGVMQGRLVPPEGGQFQSFPVRRWRDEFALAKKAGLCCIEWVYEAASADINPLSTDEGLREIRRLSEQSGVAVRSICADYFMTHRLVGEDGEPDSDAAAHLRWLIGRAGFLRAIYIVLPFVDESAMRSEKERNALPAALAPVLAAAEAANVELNLETDLPAPGLVSLLDSIGHRLVRANYDTGNSAALGFNQNEELKTLAPWLGSVHVKDRTRGGGTVALGTGNANFAACFERIHDAGFDRWFILQAARGQPGDELAWVTRQREFVESQMKVPSA